MNPHAFLSDERRSEVWIDNPPDGLAVPITVIVGRVAVGVLVGPGCNLTAEAVEAAVLACRTHLKEAPNGVYADGLGAALK